MPASPLLHSVPPPRWLPLQLTLAIAIAFSMPAAAQAQAQPGPEAGPEATPISIAAQPLGDALNELAAATGTPIAFSQALVAGKTAPAVSGRLTPREAVERLLLGSGLRAEPRGASGIVITAPPAPDAAVLTPVTVAARAERAATTEGSSSYTARASTIGKTEQSLREIPQSVTVVTRQQLDDLNVTTLPEALRYAPGITIQQNPGRDPGWINARGYDTLQMQYDGVTSATRTYGDVQANMALYDRIEIQRGPAGLLQGSGNPAGTINLVRKRGLREFGVIGSVGVGSWGRLQGDIDVTGPLNASGSVRGRAILAGYRHDAFYDHARADSLTGHASVDIDLAPRTTLGLAGTLEDGRDAVFDGLPTYTDARQLEGPRSRNLNAPWSRTDTTLKEVVADLRHHFNDDWHLRVAARYRETDLDLRSGNVRSAVDVGDHTVTAIRTEDQAVYSQYLAADINLNGRFEAFGRRHELLLGYSRDHTEFDYWWEVQPLDGPFDIGALPYDESTVVEATPKSRHETLQSGAYGMLRLHPTDTLSLILGGRLSRYDSRSRSIIPGGDASWAQGAREKDEFSPYAGVVWDFSKSVSLYASYADVFIPQTSIDWTGRTLDPRVGWQIETGLKGEFFDGALNAALAVFRLRDKNRPIPDPDPSHSVCGITGTGSCVIEGGLLQSQGWELEVSGSPAPGLELSAGYTRLLRKYLNDANNPVGVTLPGDTSNPHDLLKAWAKYSFGNAPFGGRLRGLSIGGGLTAQSETWPSWWGSGPGIRQGGYTVYSLQAAYHLSPRWSLSLTVNNLTDKRYLSRLGSGSSNNFYGEPRNALLTLRRSW